MSRFRHAARVPAECAGARVDQALARMLPEHSRSRLQAWLKAGAITVDGRTLRARDTVAGGELVEVDAELAVETESRPEAIPLKVVHQDDALIVIDKPPGLTVHPGAGRPSGTMLNALLALDPGLAHVPRAGIVHRLDKDTSGLLVVARTPEAHTRLVAALAARDFDREYEALCIGVMLSGGRVAAPIGRHAQDRLRMTVRDDGRPAVTHYRVIERFRAHSHVACKLETGRTHQIRVHLTHVGHPLVGDPLYGRRLVIPRGASEALAEALRGFKRQALHARRLALAHPLTGAPLEWTADTPADMAGLIRALREDADAHT